jgi:hypothetical protein
MNKIQLKILWVGALAFLFCLWNPEHLFGQPPISLGSDDFLIRTGSFHLWKPLLSITVLTSLLIYSCGDKNRAKLKEILQQFAGSKPKSSNTEKKTQTGSIHNES